MLGACLAVPAEAQNPVTKELVIRGLSFTGNHAIDDYTLGISIATSNSSWWARHFGFFGEKRYLDELEFRRDVLRIEALYRLSGFLEARVDTVVRRSGDGARIKFIITEGEPVRVTDLKITGAESIIPTRDLLRDLPLRIGEPFSRFLLRSSADSIQTWLQDRGYPFAEVYRGFDEDSINHNAQVSYSVDPGHLARISAVAVTGTSKVDPRVVRRAVGVRSGQPYNRKALNQTQQNLYRTDLFSYVDVGLVDSVRSGAEDSMVAVRVQVTEGKLNAVRVGAGYGTLDCFRAQAGWTGRNFFGGGRSLDVSGRVSKVAGQSIACPGVRTDDDPERQKLNYEARVSFHEPFFFSRNTNATLAFYTERHSEYKAFTRITNGAQVSIAERLTRTIPLTFSYDFALGRTIADPAIFCTYLNICQLDDTVFSAQQIESTLGLGVTITTANSLLDPIRGYSFSSQVRYSSPVIGADQQRQFAKGVIEFAQYNQIRRSGVFAWRVRLAAVLPAKLSLLGSSQQFVPPDERLYLGGPYTVRGYGQNELGPLVRVEVPVDTTTTPIKTDTVTSPTGADRLVLANAELRWHLFGRLQAAVFVDAGQIFGGQPRAPDESLRITPGIGLRFTTPLGPLRIDLAYNPADPTTGPLYQQVGSQLLLVNPAFAPDGEKFISHLRVHFSVGQAF